MPRTFKRQHADWGEAFSEGAGAGADTGVRAPVRQPARLLTVAFVVKVWVVRCTPQAQEVLAAGHDGQHALDLALGRGDGLVDVRAADDAVLVSETKGVVHGSALDVIVAVKHDQGVASNALEGVGLVVVGCVLVILLGTVGIIAVL